MWTWLNETHVGQMVFSWLKVFAATILGLFLADGADVLDVDGSDLRSWLAAGVAATLPLIINAVNPKDYRYGVNADPEYVDEVIVVNDDEV